MILVFALLAAYQIFTQIQMYITTPISTNIEADYPAKVAFPAVAICNNNQYRLTYLTGTHLLNRNTRTRQQNETLANSTNVFDKVSLLKKSELDF